MDSTIRSNLSVGPPLDLAIIRRDEFKLATHISIDMDNEYFALIRKRWGFALQEVFQRTAQSELVAAGGRPKIRVAMGDAKVVDTSTNRLN